MCPDLAAQLTLSCTYRGPGFKMRRKGGYRADGAADLLSGNGRAGGMTMTRIMSET